jgi:predicted ATP-grasp superfamily ATP-dependent carboligase
MRQSGQSNSQIRVLIPEGSSLSAREAIAALGPLGYSLAVCDPNPFCVCRFSRFVRKFYRCPRMSSDPGTYLAFIVDLLQRERFDVLIPVHENALLFSPAYAQISPHTHCAVAAFPAFERMQSKTAFTQLLDELGLPHPPTRLITRRAETEESRNFPYYVKTAYGTAGFGTWRVDNEEDHLAVIRALEENGSLDGTAPLLVQGVAPGLLEVVQAVFDHGRLVAAHNYRQTAIGVGGSAAARIGIERPIVIGHLMELGKALNWHGSLMIDYLFDERTGQIAYIDPNPRMGETMNAAYNGVNIADLIVRLSLAQMISVVKEKRAPVESHILITMLLGKAGQSGTRRAVLSELLAALFKTGCYQNSREDFSNLDQDFLSLIPVLMIAFQLLIDPKSSRKLAARAVENYALTQSAVERIQSIPAG